MDRLRALLEEIGAFLRRSRTEAELDEELRHHLEMETEANLRAGMDPREARRRARLAFGGTDWFTERVRDEWWGRTLEDLGRDVRFGARNLRKRLAFTVAAAVTLSLGIGMTTTMFVLVDAVLLRPLPGADTERMVYLELESADGRMTTSPTPELLRLVRDHATSFSRVEAYTTEPIHLTIDGEPLRDVGARASTGFFDFLGVKPILGRTFRPHDGVGTSGQVAILGHTLWEERFGGSPSVLGQTVRVDDRVLEIVGVLPTNFRVDTRREVALWFPAGDTGALFAEGVPVEGALGKLAEGVSLATARAELDAIVQNNPLTRRADMEWSGRVRTPLDLVDPRLVRALLVLQVAALLVLLVGCGNLTNLLLAQGETRARELALRASLGARRGRLVRQLLTESLLLGLLGGVGGTLLTLWALGVLPLFLPPGYAGLDPGATVSLFATSVALGSVLVVGVLPAIRGSKRGLAETIKGVASSRSGARRRFGVRQALVTVEVAMTVLLLAGAGLLLKSFAGLSRMDTGFDTRDLVTLHVELPEDRYEDAEARSAFVARLRAGVEQGLPPQLGTATLASGFVDHLSASFAPLVPGDDKTEEAERVIVVTWDVAPRWFALVGLPILQGRGFVDEDGRGGEPVVIVNETVARRYFPDQDPVGRRLRAGADVYRVVGVSASLRLPDMAGNGFGDLQLFFPLGQDTGPGVTILTRVRSDPSGVIGLLKQAVWRIDPTLPVVDVATVDDLLAESLAQQRSNALLMILFSLTSLLLGAVGIYGVVAYSVTRRVREMGIRLALGASAGEVVSHLVVEGMKTVALGLTLGAAGALALGTTFSSLLHEVDPSDPGVLLAVLLATTAVSFLSTWLPARRGAGLGPIQALRNE